MTEEIELPEQAPATEAVQKLAAEALAKLRDLPYAQRHPEFKKFKCQVCHRRHPKPQCPTVYAVWYIEEDLETGEKTTVYQMAAQTPKGIMGAALVKGKRIKPHPNQKQLRFIERVRAVYQNDYPQDEERSHKALQIARHLAYRQLREEREEQDKSKRHQQQVSRRINLGLLPAGSR